MLPLHSHVCCRYSVHWNVQGQTSMGWYLYQLLGSWQRHRHRGLPHLRCSARHFWIHPLWWRLHGSVSIWDKDTYNEGSASQCLCVILAPELCSQCPQWRLGWPSCQPGECWISLLALSMSLNLTAIRVLLNCKHMCQCCLRWPQISTQSWQIQHRTYRAPSLLWICSWSPDEHLKGKTRTSQEGQGTCVETPESSPYI